jgi:HlyD family secretion protein
VLRVSERSERIVAAGTTLLEIGDPSSLEIVIDLLSSDAATVHPGDRVRLGGWSTEGAGEANGPGWGRVREIEPAGFTKVSALGVDEQRVNVIVEPQSIPSTVGDAFRVEASIIVWSAPNVIAVPRNSLLQSGDAWIAFAIRRGRVERRVVRLGHLAGSSAEVLSGIGVGDEVVLFPSDRIVAGVRVARRGD